LSSGNISSGAIVYGNFVSGAVTSGAMVLSGSVREVNIDPTVLGAKGCEYFRQVGVNTHWQNSIGFRSGSGKCWYVAGFLNRYGSTEEAQWGAAYIGDQKLYAFPFFSARGGTVQEIGAYCYAISTSSGAKCQLGIYSCQSGGQNIWPGALLASSAESYLDSGHISSGTLISFNPGLALTPNSLYFLSFATHPVVGGAYFIMMGSKSYSPWGYNNRFNYNSVMSPHGCWVYNNSYFSGNWPMPNPFPNNSGGLANANIFLPAVGLRF
jgi:hypothetical protein